MRVVPAVALVLLLTGCRARLGPSDAASDGAVARCTPGGIASELRHVPALQRPPQTTYARYGSTLSCVGSGPYSAACTPNAMPATPGALLRLRPSEGWAQREAWLRRPLASESEERIRCLCESRARKKSAMLAGAGLFALGLYGASAWDYGSSSFHVADEDWFGQHTDYGGADKAGHFITSYILASAAAAAHRSWGLGRREAAWRGAASSMLWMTAIEVGDGFSEKYGFSYQDLIADAVGCLAAWLHETSPWVHRTIDFRWEYWPSESGLNGDEAITDDYDGSAYLMALNAGALLSRRPTAWDLLDLQVGYQTRGYLKESDTPERWVFVGLGLNLANLLRRLGFRYAALFDYYQVPFLSLRLGYELNEGTTDLLYAP